VGQSLCKKEGTSMKKIIIGAVTTLLSVAVALVFISGAFASPTPPSKHQTVNRSSLTRTEASVLTQTKPVITCTNKGAQLVNVTYKISNDADSGDGGNYWAYDAMTRQLQIWVSTTGPNTYCADIKDSGTFTTQAGVRSPGSFMVNGSFINGGVVDGTEVGTFKGGAVFTITGTFNANDPTNWPALPSTNHNGNGGQTLNAGCVITAPAGTINSGCAPVTHNWEAHYFSAGYQETAIPVWGWFYIGVDHSTAPDAGTSAGRWNNFYTGDSGDILDVD
jgi:hypothetical protein